MEACTCTNGNQVFKCQKDPGNVLSMCEKNSSPIVCIGRYMAVLTHHISGDLNHLLVEFGAN